MGQDQSAKRTSNSAMAEVNIASSRMSEISSCCADASRENAAARGAQACARARHAPTAFPGLVHTLGVGWKLPPAMEEDLNTPARTRQQAVTLQALWSCDSFRRRSLTARSRSHPLTRKSPEASTV